MTRILTPVAERYGLSLDSFGKLVRTGSGGRLSLSDAFDTALEPSPVTPTKNSTPYALLAGTIVAAIQRVHNGSNIVVQPTYALGNTGKILLLGKAQLK